MRLHDIARCRAGDKGTANTLSVFARNRDHFAAVAEMLSTEAVARHLRDFTGSDISRYELPNVAAVHLTLHEMKRGDVTTTLDLDPHGKTLAAILLEMDIPRETVIRHGLDETRRIEGITISDEVILSPRPLVLTLAGAGLDPVDFDAAIGVNDARILHLDYLAGTSSMSVPTIADQLGLRLRHRKGKTVLLGHGLGATVAALTAGWHPNLIDGLVLSGIGPSTRAHHDCGLKAASEMVWTAQSQAAYLDTCTAGDLDERIRSRQLSHLGSIDLDRLASAADALRTIDITEIARSITATTAIIHGLHDARRLLEAATMMREAIDDCELFILDCGHTPFVEDPAASARLIDSIIREASC